jgi:hypothetical protein
MEGTDKIVKELEELSFIDAEKSFEYARVCSRNLRHHDMEEAGRRIIINVLDNWDKVDKSTYEMWSNLIESAGFYPYLEKEKKRLTFVNTAGEIRKEFHKSDNLDQYFHEEQKILNGILNSEKNLIVSAPTSFGKSLLVQEVVAAKKYTNIVIIQPSLALIDETRNKLKKFSKDYKIIVRTSQKPSNEKGNLFLFTAERVMEYSEFPKIDFFVIDEFYRLSAKRDEERSDVLNNAFNLLVNKHNSKFYLLGPNIDRISEGFAEKYDAEFCNTKYSLVDNRIIDMSSSDFGDRGTKRIAKERALFDLLLKLKKEQNIVYCSSPQRVQLLARRFCDYMDKSETERINEELSLTKWAKINVGEKWGLINCLNHRVGIHDGTIPKHITSSIMTYFNDGRINYLFCTTTIIEGVNTSAKNVVFFDRTKGLRKRIDFFDYSNIKGRSGRMMVHYVGRIYNFNTPPQATPVLIDIPFFEQKDVSDEILINIADEDVKDKESEQYKNLSRIPKEEKELFKRNGVLVKGQLRILDTLKSDIDEKHRLIYWNNFPRYRQLEYALTLAWNNLVKKGETIRPMTLPKLVKVTFDYSKHRNISELISDTYSYYSKHRSENDRRTDEEIFDAAVTHVFWIMRHWFHYKVPKWISVIDSLQKYVCEKRGLRPGNYTHFSNQIENDFVNENLAILYEYGIPKSAIDKISARLPPDLSEEEIIEEIKKKRLFENPDLIEYEKEKMVENL